MMIGSSPSVECTSGEHSSRPLFAPVIVTRIIGISSNGPPHRF